MGLKLAGAASGTDSRRSPAARLSTTPPSRRLAHWHCEGWPLLLARYAPHDGVFPLRLPGTYAVRRSRLTTEPTYSTTGPALCVVAQGAKVVMLGRDVLEYDPAHVLVFAVDLPVSSQVTRASRKDPYLGFVLNLDPARVAELAARVYPRGVPKAPDNRGLYVGRATDGIVDAVTRLLDLMAQPEDANLLGPLVVDEILIRLLRTSDRPPGRADRPAQVRSAASGRSRVLDPRAFRATRHGRGDGRVGPHERVVVSPALQSGDLDEPAPIPESAPAARSPAADAVSERWTRATRATASAT